MRLGFVLAFLFALVFPVSGYAASISLSAQFTPARKTQIVAQMHLSVKDKAQGEICFYLPLNDPEVEYNPLKRFDLFQDKYAVRRRDSGSIKVAKVIGGQIIAHDPSDELARVVKIKVLSSDELILHFSTQLPRWPNFEKDQWQAIHFHPIPMQTCDYQESGAYHTSLNNRYRMRLQYPSNMLLAANAVEISSKQNIGPFRQRTYEFTGESLAFVAGDKLQRRLVKQGEYYLEVVFRSADFLKLVEPMLDVINYHSELFGKFPFKKLTVVESSELENSEVPGMIVINQPKTAASTGAQQFFTNWTVWQMAYFAAEQWNGAAIKYRSMDDYWYFKGVNDFATYRALKRVKEGYDFFRAYDNNPPPFTFNYRQNQDLMSVLLNFFQFRNHLVNETLETARPAEDQHPLTYIRHAVALRQVDWAFGSEKFASVMREFTHRNLFKRVMPKDFLESRFQSLSKIERLKLNSFLRQWWQTNDWPDFYIDDLITEELPGDIYKVDVFVRESSDFNFPISIEAIDEQGETYQQRVEAQQEGNWKATFHLRAPLSSVYIDPEKEVFDWDRYNNTNKWGSFYFFPGSARSLYDEDYTVLWLPMLGKLPGDKLTLYLTAQALRYIHTGLTAVLNYTPEDESAGFFLMYETLWPKIGAYSLLSVEQDSAINRDERIAEVSIVKEPFLSMNPNLSFEIFSRHRQLIGQSKTGHEAMGVGFKLSPLNRRNCNYLFQFRGETTVSARDSDLEYERRWAKLEGNCRLTRALDFGLRLFSGKLEAKSDNVPKNVFLLPQNVDEARVRIPSPRIAGFEDIRTFSADILLPASLGLGGIALDNQVRWRLFYDFATSRTRRSDLRASGIGLYMPLGGNVVGKGGISFLKFSLLYVPYVRLADGQKGTGGVLFDFFGNL